MLQLIFMPLFKHPPFQSSLACSFLLFVLFLDWLKHSLKPLIKLLFLFFSRSGMGKLQSAVCRPRPAHHLFL